MDDPTRADGGGSIATPHPRDDEPRADRRGQLFLPGIPMPVDIARPHTAGRLARLDPDVYTAVAAAFFGGGMGIRDICRTYHVSPHTVQAVVARHTDTQSADGWREAQSRRLRSIALLASGAAADLLADPDAVDAAGIKGVATLLRETVHAHELLAGRMPGQQPGRDTPIIDVMDEAEAATDTASANRLPGAGGDTRAEPADAGDAAAAVIPSQCPQSIATATGAAAADEVCNEGGSPARAGEPGHEDREGGGTGAPKAPPPVGECICPGRGGKEEGV